MTLAILCPTRDRVEQCRRMMASALDSSDAEIYLYVANNDPAYSNYIDYFTHQERTKIIVGPDTPTAHKWNVLADMAMEDGHSILMLGSDDMYFNGPGWEGAIAAHYDKLESKAHVYALQDSRDQDGVPHPLITKEYVEIMNYFVPPIFLHWKIDIWTVAVAKANGIFTHIRDHLLTHEKPSDIGEGDMTHNRIRAMGWRERDDYVATKMPHILEAEKARLGAALLAIEKGSNK